MNKYFLIGTVAASFVCFLIFIFISSSNYEKKMKEKYFLRNHFPYELNVDRGFKDNIAGNCFLILSMVFFACSFVVALFNKMNGFYIFIFIIGIMTSLIPVALFFTSLSQGKIHIIFFSISCFISLLNFGVLGIEHIHMFNEVKITSYLFGAIISFLFLAAILALVINPKLSHWAVMEKKINSDGSITYVRPKFFPLAFSEWLLMFIDLFSLISLLILIWMI